MILGPTVFVLGAGASQSYGFPSGAALVRKVCADLRADHGCHPSLAALLQCGVRIDDVHRFRNDLFASSRRSIDAFLESRPDYDRVGRLAIAQQLLRIEDERNLWPDGDQDWCNTLFSVILGNSAADFKTNTVKVITFNFDRSFERKLFLVLKANYAQDDPVALTKCIPVLHVHGQLGNPDWLPGEVGFRRSYEPSDLPNEIEECTKQINIVRDPINEDVVETARRWLSAAERVYFLGFGYHRSNLEKLDVPNVLLGKHSVGTAIGIDQGPLHRLRNLLGDRVMLLDRNIDQFVRTEPFLYD